MVEFTHLHTHSYYSLLDGLSSPEQLVLTAKELGQKSIGLTDHGSLYGLVEFYKAATKNDIKPIMGVETYVAADGRFTKNAKSEWPAHLILLAASDAGYKNLMKLISLAHTEGYYYRPRVDQELLKEYAEGIICTSACLGGEVLQALLKGREDEAREVIKNYQKIFGKENFYLEIQPRPEIEDAHIAYPRLVELSRQVKIPLVAANDIHYAKAEQQEAHDALLCVQTGKRLKDTDRMRLEGDYYVRSNEDMQRLLTESYGEEVAKEAMATTQEIANRCNVDIPLGEAYFPKFETPDQLSAMDYLRQVSYEGLAERYEVAVQNTINRLDNPDQEPANEEQKKEFAIIDRLLFELSIIEKMDFPTYFLIVWDFVRAAKEMGVVVGPGRGSAAGSITTYCLKITDIDPLKYNLLFERFLNPDRISLPDIDIDFADVRRGDVIKYVEEKYGIEKVAQICTFGTMKARAAIRDVGRVMDVPLSRVDQIAKLIPAKPGSTIAGALESDVELNSIYKTDPEITKLIDLALQVEGCVRHVSTHASAVVISPTELTDFTPVQHATREDGVIITQYPMGPVEAVGLVKMDFLGLRNLTIIERALAIINKLHNKEINLNELGEDDPKTMELLGLGHTTGVFQFESAGMRRYLRELKPNHIEDLIAMVALYRPGPMTTGYIDKFVRRKQGKEEVRVDHPLMAEALKNTYGVIVYQEQVMQISKDMASFTGGQADTLRKGMGKKIKEVMEKMSKDFVDGSVKNGVDRAIAAKVFSEMEQFAGYAFNKSHAACYATIAYQTAYLKAHYPIEFMAALLTTDMDNLDRVTMDLKECQELGIDVLPPSVSESMGTFTVVEEGIRFGLNAIKNLGANAVTAIVEEHKANGEFKSLDDFLARVDADSINKKSIEALAKAGAFEGLADRNAIIQNLDHLTSYAREVQGKAAGGQGDLFSLLGEQHQTSIPKLTLPPVDPLPERDILAYEKEVLGMFVSEHPFVAIMPYLEKQNMTLSSINARDEGKSRRVAGMITETKRITTKKGDNMMFARIEDLSDSLELVIFPRTMNKYFEIIENDIPCYFEGKVSYKNGRGDMTDEPKMLLDKMEVIDVEKIKAHLEKHPIEREEKPKAEQVYVVSVPSDLPRERLEELKKLLVQNKGDVPCIVSFVDGERVIKKVKLPFGINITSTLQVGIESLTKGLDRAAI
jgi:DNA polymerase-3 subunit alpha